MVQICILYPQRMDNYSANLIVRKLPSKAPSIPPTNAPLNKTTTYYVSPISSDNSNPQMYHINLNLAQILQKYTILENILFL